MKANLYRRTFAFVFLLSQIFALTVRAAERPKRTESLPRESSDMRDSRGGTIPGADYVLQPLDVLKIFVFQHDDINKQTEAVRVSDEYTVNLPLVNTINLRGKTARQAEEIIRAAYDKDFLVNPQVSVIIVKYAERSVNVIGAVQKADRVLFPQEKGLTIIEAITLAGGHSRLADLKRVKLTRKKDNGETVVEEIDVDALMKRGGRDAIQLQQDDVIFVPERIL